MQTFVVQLAGQYGKGVIGGYVPTKRAEEGGSYGATIKSNRVGHGGGQEMVDALGGHANGSLRLRQDTG